MWNTINGPIKRIAGAAGTITLSNGGKILSIIAHATSAGTVAFPDGMGGTLSIPVPAGTWFAYDPKHLGCAIKAGGTIVFTSTDSFLVEFME